MTTSPEPSAGAAGAHLAVSTELRELAWTIHRHAPQRAGVGPIPTTEIALLKQIVDTPGATVGQLVEALGLRQPNVSAAVRAMVQRGLVTREQDAADRRVARIRPTPAGLAEHRAISEAWMRPVDDAVTALDADQQRALVAALDALRSVHDALRSASGPADDTP